MITRLEVDGFKNLLGFSIELGPFNCLAGPNGVGKSNLFDVIRLLSLLADHTLTEAALRLRGQSIDTADLRDLLWRDRQHSDERLRIAVEMLVAPDVTDDFGRTAEVTSTFLRYELELGYEAPNASHKMPRLVLQHESLSPITEGKASLRIRFPHSAKQFRQDVVKNGRRAATGFISTHHGHDGHTEIHVHQDGGSRGNPQRAPAITAPRTTLGATNTVSTPTVLAARREMQKWRHFALEPSSMRRADPFHADHHVAPDGAHLAATLHRLIAGPDGDKVRARIASRLAEFVPITDVAVDVDEVRQLFTLQVDELDGASLPARSLSDGTLRFLALCVLHEDAEVEGVLCLEEPENGIHPARLEPMLTLLQDLSVDASRKPGPDNPMRQVLVATHSPHFVQRQRPDDLLLAEQARIRRSDGRVATTLRCRPLSNTWRRSKDERGVSLGHAIHYLLPPGGPTLRDDMGVELHP